MDLHVKCKSYYKIHFPTAVKKEYLVKQGKLIQFPLRSVGYELSSRAVASQVFSPLQRLTSVFGMGTGGPTALKTLTTNNLLLVLCIFKTCVSKMLWCTSGDSNPRSNATFTVGEIKSSLTRAVSPLYTLVHLRGLEPRTH